MTTAYTPHDLYIQMTTGALGTALAADVTADNTAAIQAILNATTGAFAGTVPASDMPNSSLQALVDFGEWQYMTANQISTWDSIAAVEVVAIGSSGVQSGLNYAFENAPNSLAAVQAAYNQPASFVQARYGLAQFPNGITTDQIEAALEGK